jgi:hypothetical protein
LHTDDIDFADAESRKQKRDGKLLKRDGNQNFIITLATNFGGAFAHSGKALKRESGESPEQTRCCKLKFSYELNGETTPSHC